MTNNQILLYRVSKEERLMKSHATNVTERCLWLIQKVYYSVISHLLCPVTVLVQPMQTYNDCMNRKRLVGGRCAVMMTSDITYSIYPRWCETTSKADTKQKKSKKEIVSSWGDHGTNRNGRMVGFGYAAVKLTTGGSDEARIKNIKPWYYISIQELFLRKFMVWKVLTTNTQNNIEKQSMRT